MRYSSDEAPIVPAVLPSGGTVTCRVLRQETNALLTLTNDQAVATALPGVWQLPLSRITPVPEGLSQLVVEFVHSAGSKDYAKVAVRGVLDEITKTLRLVMTVV